MQQGTGNLINNIRNLQEIGKDGNLLKQEGVVSVSQ